VEWHKVFRAAQLRPTVGHLAIMQPVPIFGPLLNFVNPTLDIPNFSAHKRATQKPAISPI